MKSFKSFLNSYYLRLSAIFLVLMAVMAAAHVFITLRIAERESVELDQRVNRGLASDMVPEIQPQIEEGLDLGRIGPIIHYMMVLNPAVEIYVLDGEGRILAFYAQPGARIQRESVDLAPISAFLEESAKLPIYGDDPRNLRQQKHFSAAPISLGEKGKGYLYIILRSSLYDMVENRLGERYLLSALRNSLLITVPIVGIIGLLLFALMTKRLSHLARVVTEFGSGSHEERAAISSKDEFGELAGSFNRMADTIEANIKALTEADRQRRDLVANVSHDLRNPLASIQGYAETLMMKQDSLKPAERRQYLEVILDSTRLLNRLVEELFELSKLESDEAAPSLSEFPLSELAQGVFLKMKPKAEKRRIRFSADITKEACPVTADGSLIERVITNLVDNALKFTPPEGSVELTLQVHDRRGVLRVSDTGPGIAEAELPYIFDRFYIGDESRSQSRRGSGLGLAISQKIMELHGSSIRAQNRVGTGSIFSFSLPTAD